MNPDAPVLREVRDDDWPTVFEVANASVAHIAGAPTQEEWLHNRRHFDASHGEQRHFVAVDSETDVVLGYGSVECSPEFRIFVVTRPEHLPTVGELLYERSLTLLRDAGAARVWFTEYGSDRALLAFARAHGFSNPRSFTLPDGLQATTLVKRLID